LSTFVSVGNALQPFTRLLDAVSRIAPQLPQPVIVQSGHTPLVERTFRSVPFIGMDEFSRNIREADLLILHAGAGSVIHAVEAGKVPVIMPRRFAFGEHVNDHQVELARALAEVGKVAMAEGPDDLARAVGEAIARQRSAQVQGTRGHPPPMLVPIIQRVLCEYADRLS
jgi:UDP-N-acetylglucosamine transferase subunit ALG13